MMATIFRTKVMLGASKSRTKILDAGCGYCIQALFLARRNPQSSVLGYDISHEAIGQADEYRRKRGVTNATFIVASHDDFQLPYEMDMIYTAGSLIGEDEIFTPFYCDVSSPLMAAKRIVRSRLIRFKDMLLPSGIYIQTWGSTQKADQDFVNIAKDCGLMQVAHIDGGIPEDYKDSPPEYAMHNSALIFRRS